jgi:hypothetical protein
MTLFSGFMASKKVLAIPTVAVLPSGPLSARGCGRFFTDVRRNSVGMSKRSGSSAVGSRMRGLATALLPTVSLGLRTREFRTKLNSRASELASSLLDVPIRMCCCWESVPPSVDANMTMIGRAMARKYFIFDFPLLLYFQCLVAQVVP